MYRINGKVVTGVKEEADTIVVFSKGDVAKYPQDVLLNIHESVAGHDKGMFKMSAAKFHKLFTTEYAMPRPACTKHKAWNTKLICVIILCLVFILTNVGVYIVGYRSGVESVPTLLEQEAE